MSERHSPVVTFDASSVDVAQRQHEIYDDLRSRCPVAWSDAHDGFWVLTKYADVAAAARDAKTFGSQNEPTMSFPKGIHIPPAPFRYGIAEMDAPRHSVFRRAMMGRFALPEITKMVPDIQAYTRGCVDQIVAKGSPADLVRDLCVPVPAMTTLAIWGMPVEDWPKYEAAYHQSIYTPPDDPTRPAIDEAMQAVAEDIAEFVERKRREPDDSLGSQLANLEVDGELCSVDEIVGMGMVVLSGGLDTTTALAASSLLHLQRDHELRTRLCNDVDLLDVAFDEFIRVYSPAQGLARNVMADTEVREKCMVRGERLYISWAAANRDPDQFPDPHRLDIDRTEKRHLSFGLGPHHCLGQYLAKAEWVAIVSEVLRRLPDYEIDESSATRYPSIGVVDGWINLPIVFTAGAKL